MPVLADCQTGKPGADSLILPSINREWTIYDFQELYKLVLASQNGTPGGIITIENNEPLFTKLTSIKNYWFLKNTEYTVTDRITYCDSLQRYAKPVFLNYYQKSRLVNGRLSYEREIAGMLDIMFEVTKIQMGMVDEIIKAKPNLNEKQQAGVKQMSQGVTTMENGVLLTIEKEYRYFSQASICKMSKTFKDFYTVMYSKIDADVKAEFDKRIANIIKTHPIQCVRTILQGE